LLRRAGRGLRGRGRGRRGAGVAALPPALQGPPAGPGAAVHRHRLRLGGGLQLVFRPDHAALHAAGLARRPPGPAGPGGQPLPPVPDRLRRAGARGPAAGPGQDTLRRHGARRGGQPARGRGHGHPRAAPVLPDVLAGLRPGRPGRRAEPGHAGTGAVLSPEVPRVLPDRGVRRRRRHHHRPLRRRAASRHRRRRRQVLPAASRRLPGLRVHDRHAAAAAQRHRSAQGARMKTTFTLSPLQLRAAEAAFWVGLASCFFLLPDKLTLMSQILIFGLFAVSLDMALGYAGILTVGHAAFFGAGAYAAGLLTTHGWSEPISGLLIAMAVCLALGYLLSALVVRGTDLARLMITIGVCMLLAELANRLSGITGGTD